MNSRRVSSVCVLTLLFLTGSGVMYLDGCGRGGGGVEGLPSDLMEVAGGQYAPLEGLAPGSQAAQDSQKHAVQQLGLPLEVRTLQTGIVLRLIPAGTFTMGSPGGKAGRDSDEGPQHQVTLTKGFYCGKFEVTQGQWQAVMGNSPSYSASSGPDAPVENVSWDDCQTFLTKLCQKEGVARGTYRLLTEAQWEYACRAGSQGVYCFGDSASGLGEYAWYRNIMGSTHPVGQKRPNAFGLYDMHGNVWEWCQDWYDSGYYSGSPASDPLGPGSGDGRVNRGGSWYADAVGCRSAGRNRNSPGLRDDNLGLRLARTIP